MTLPPWHLAYLSLFQIKHILNKVHHIQHYAQNTFSITSFDALCHRIVWPRQRTAPNVVALCGFTSRWQFTWFYVFITSCLWSACMCTSFLCDKNWEIRLRFLLLQLTKETCLKRRRRREAVIYERNAQTWDFPSPLSLSFFSTPSQLVSMRSSDPTWS